MQMHSFVRLTFIRRLLTSLCVFAAVYLVFNTFFIPYRLKPTNARYILSFEQRNVQFNAPNNDFNVVSDDNQDLLGQQLVLTNSSTNSESSLIDDLTIETNKFVVNSASGDGNLSICPDINENKNFIGHLSQAVLLITNLKEDEVAKHHKFLTNGGHWAPKECVARYKVAIIIPFRDRQTHLTRLIEFLIPILKRQLLDFRFIVTEQYGKGLFNKGRIMNAAFRFAEKLGVECVIFHDVDMFPQDDRNSYGCSKSPRHIGAFVNNLGYQLWYNEIVGGVLAMNMFDYRTVNGYSNMYWAWGGEDDDMGIRILANNLTIERPDSKIGRFSMLKHAKRKRTAPKLIYTLLDSAKTRWVTDGLNVTSWKIRKVFVRPLYYHLFVDVGQAPKEWQAQS